LIFKSFIDILKYPSILLKSAIDYIY